MRPGRLRPNPFSVIDRPCFFIGVGMVVVYGNGRTNHARSSVDVLRPGKMRLTFRLRNEYWAAVNNTGKRCREKLSPELVWRGYPHNQCIIGRGHDGNHRLITGQEWATVEHLPELCSSPAEQAS